MSGDEFHSVVARFACEVQWGDCDPAGIIFYPTYFRWMDAATWAFLDSVGYNARRCREEHRAMPLVSAECQFLAPAGQGDRCEVRSRLPRSGPHALAEQAHHGRLGPQPTNSPIARSTAPTSPVNHSGDAPSRRTLSGVGGS